MASIQPRTSPIKFAHFAEKAEKGSISNLSTKVAQAVLGNVATASGILRRMDKPEDYLPDGHMSQMSEAELEKMNMEFTPLAQHFRAQPFSFNELLNMKPKVAPIEEAFEKTRVFSGGTTFSWESVGNLLEYQVAESGRPGRAQLLAKRPHYRLRRLSAELQNVGEASGKLRPFRTF